MTFKLAGLSVEQVPAITKWGFEDLGDDPTKHRWRAWWAGGDGDGETHGIELRAYPVIKVNPASVWINEDGYRQATRQPWEDGAPAKEWVPFDPRNARRRLCHNGAGAAWAKPTQDEAILSLAIRLMRWTARLNTEMKRAETAIKVMEALRPDLPSWTECARQNLAGQAQTRWLEDY
jgi:hypothetical protein